MSFFNPQSVIPPRVLATDLDGTFIPLADTAANVEALSTLRAQHQEDVFRLIFATGRRFDSVMEAISSYSLPVPEWIVCDVGSSIYQRDGGSFSLYSAYAEHLQSLTRDLGRSVVEQTLQGVPQLERQAQEHQQRFKISYECEPELLDSLVEKVKRTLQDQALPYECMGSVDPFMNRGLIDVLPVGVTKAYALIWLATHADFSPDEVVYSGDSGNDYAALVCGFRAIVVGNASAGLVQQVSDALAQRNLKQRLYCAKEEATSGVLEGCQHFGLFA